MLKNDVTAARCPAHARATKTLHHFEIAPRHTLLCHALAELKISCGRTVSLEALAVIVSVKGGILVAIVLRQRSDVVDTYRRDAMDLIYLFIGPYLRRPKRQTKSTRLIDIVALLSDGLPQKKPGAKTPGQGAAWLSRHGEAGAVYFNATLSAGGAE